MKRESMGRIGRLLLAAIVCCGLGEAVFASAPAPSRADTKPATRAPKPNIVFIMADDLGYGHLGCYGQTKIETPHLDRLAEQGLRFTQCYAGCAVCAPCRSVLMTGYHMGHTSVRGNSGGIPLLDEDITVAEMLKQAGYVTGGFGKWGLGDHATTGEPTRQGFDEFFGYLHQVHAHFYYPEYLWSNTERYPLPGNTDGRREQYSHDVIFAKAMDFLRRHRRQRFFLYLPVTIPHYELLVPEDSLAVYRGRFPETPYRDRRRHYADQDHPRAATAAMISRLDRDVGRLLKELEALGLENDTIVFFTSDNGATPGPSDPDFFRACGPLRGYKATLYEGGLRVPMIVRWPGHVPAGVTSEFVWSFADVMPTLCELAGIEPPEGIDGLSVLPVLLGQPEKAQRHLYHYWELRNQRAIRLGDWKAIRRSGQPLELYDLRNDIGERTNVADRYPDLAGRLSFLMEQAHTPARPQKEPPMPPGRRYR